jgi:hypothetical protein
MDDQILVSYLAGVFDGEGSITTFKRRDPGRRPIARPSILVRMAWLPTLNKFLERFGGKIRRCCASTETHKALFEWSLRSHREQATFLSAILPLLGEKRVQAQLLLAYLAERLKHPLRRMPQSVFDLGQILHDRLRVEKRVHFGP